MPGSDNKNVRFRSQDVRVSVNNPARLIFENDVSSCDVQIIDVSQDGFRIKAPRPLEYPLDATLRIDREGDFPVQVRWSRRGEAGGIFLEGPPRLD